MSQCRKCGKSIKIWMSKDGVCDECVSRPPIPRKEDEIEQKLAKQKLEAIMIVMNLNPDAKSNKIRHMGRFWSLV